MAFTKAIIIIMLNEGRGSKLVVQMQLKAFQQEGYETILVSPQPYQGVQSVTVDLKGLPLPIHESLPYKHTVLAPLISPHDLSFYLTQYEQGIANAIANLNTKGISSQNILLFVHHANLHLIAAHNVSKCMQLRGTYLAGLLVQPHGTCIRGHIKCGTPQAASQGLPEGIQWGKIVAALNAADAIIAISDFVKNSLIAPYVINKGNIQTIYLEAPVLSPISGYNQEISHLLDKYSLSDEPYVLMTGILNSQKNQMGLAEASHLYMHKAYTVFIGDDPSDMSAELLRRGARCYHIGRVSDHDRNILMTYAKYAINAHRQEDFGFTLIEAALLGTPAIGYASGGTAEIIQDKINGYHARTLTSESLGRVILYGLHNSPLLYGDKLRKYTQERFGFKNTTGKMLKLVDGIFTNRKA